MSTPDEVLTEASSSLPAGAMVTGAIAIVEYVLPAEDSPEERGPFLTFRRDTSNGIWKHIGMLTTISDDLRHDLRQAMDDDG